VRAGPVVVVVVNDHHRRPGNVRRPRRGTTKPGRSVLPIETCRDLDRLLREARLVVLRREAPALETLAKIEDAFSSALRKGAAAIRYLGNLGIGRDPLPGSGADEVIDLETGATALALRYPCVIVCMYDVNTVSGHLLLNAGFGTHPLTVWKDVLQQNPHGPTSKSAGA